MPVCTASSAAAAAAAATAAHQHAPSSFSTLTALSSAGFICFPGRVSSVTQAGLRLTGLSPECLRGCAQSRLPVPASGLGTKVILLVSAACESASDKMQRLHRRDCVTEHDRKSASIPQSRAHCCQVAHWLCWKPSGQHKGG